MFVIKSFIQKFNKYKYPYTFIAPTMILLFMFSIVPIIISVVVSFTDMNLKGLRDWSKIQFIGINNYTKLFSDDLFIKALGNTLFYVLMGVPLVILFSLLVAMLLNAGNSRLFKSCRMLYYAPAITNIVAVAVIWGFLYNTNYGLINQVLEFFGVAPVSWLLDPKVAKISLVILAVWKAIGINMLIFLAALKDIPISYYEAANLDGATKMQQIRYITLPLLKFSTFFVTVTTLIGWIQFFEEPLVMTQGGPLDSTMSMALLIYQNGFKRSNFGYAAAGSLVLFIIILIVTIVQLRLNKEEH